MTIPRNNSDVIIHSIDEQLHIRNTSNLSLIDWVAVDGYVWDLDADWTGNYVVGRTAKAGQPSRWLTFDTFHKGWQLEPYDVSTAPEMTASAIHPLPFDDGPRRYFCFANDPDVIRERTGRTNWGNSFTTGSAADIGVSAIAVGKYRGSTRIAGLLENSHIDVWDQNNNHLFTFNRDRAKTLNRGILEFTPNGEILVTAEGLMVIFWDMSPRAGHLDRIAVPALNAEITALAISNSGKRLAVGLDTGSVFIYRWSGEDAPAAPAQEAEPAQPTALLENYPNPFNPETWIPYQLSEAAEVTVTIHSSDGKLVRTLELGQMPAGAYSDKDRAAYWDGQNEQGEPVASGVYFYTLTAGDFSATRKMVIRK